MDFVKLADVFFNGRPAKPEQKPKVEVTVEELILRKVSHIRVRGTVYKVVVTEVAKTTWPPK